MTVYVLYMLLVTGQALIIYGSQIRKKRQMFLFIAFVELVFIAGLRSFNIGADTLVYINALDRFNALSIKDVVLVGDKVYGFEIGYTLFTMLLSKVTSHGTVFLIFVAGVMYYPVFKTIEKYSYYPLISIFVYFAFSFFYYSLGIIRQMLALSICICGLPFLLGADEDKENNWKFILVVLFATTFHTTAICWLVLWAIKKVNIAKIKYHVIPIALICLIFGRYFLRIILLVFPKYSSYIGTAYEEGGGSYLMLACLILFYIATIFYVRYEDMNNCERMSIRGLILAIFLQAVSYSFGLMGRAVVYYSFFLVIIAPMLIKKMRIKQHKILYGAMWGGLLLIAVYVQFWNNKYICPYQFFWER